MSGPELLTSLLPRRGWLPILGWTAVETGPVLASGYVVARAVDAGFLAGRPLVGLALLAALAGLYLARGTAERALFGAFAAIVEPMRDALVERVVDATLQHAAATRSSHSTEPDAAVVARLTGQVEAVRGLCGALLRITRPVLVRIIAAAIGLCALAPQLVTVVVPALVLVAGVFPLSVRALVRARRAMTLAEEEVAARSGHAVRAARDLAALGATDVALAEVEAATDAYTRAALTQARASCSRVLLTTLGGRVPLVLVLVLAPSMIADGTVTTGALLGAVVYLSAQLIPALAAATGLVSNYWTQLGVVLGRLAETTTPRPRTTLPASDGPTVGDLVATGLTFAYGPAAAPVVDGLDLRLAPGERLAIVGASGIGKSTVAALLAGVETPDTGRVTLGGTDLAGLSPDTRRRHVAVVPQQAYVFEGSLRENLCYLSGPLPDADLDAAAAATGATHLGSYDAPADGLDAGDRQLVALTRTLLARTPVVVLDEATGHLDAAAEARAEAAFAGSTVIVVAHRLTAAARADRVLLLTEHGAELGTHTELLARSTAYRRLVAAAAAPAANERHTSVLAPG